jgi:cytochrome b6-f complex iron-sulfur subunit
MSCSRREFIVLVPAAVGASAFATLPACGSGVDGTVTVANGKALLSFAQFPSLMTTGGGVIVDTSDGRTIAVVRTDGTRAVALSAICTHAGCTVSYEQGAMDLFCHCHSSRFNLTGAPTAGPAPSPLAGFTTVIDGNGVTVTL